MRTTNSLILLIVVSIMGGTTEAASVTNRDFLSVGQGARADGMGEAFVAVADDTSAIFWNPAGLTQLTSDEFSASYADRYDGLNHEAQMHYARRGRQGMWGFAYAGSYVTGIPVTQSLTDADINAIQTGTFAATDNPTKNLLDHAFLFSYSRPLSPESHHAMGATVKMIYRDFLGMVHGYGSAVDIGYHYTAMSGNLRFGANLQNALSLVSYTGTIDNLGVNATATESYVSNLKTGVAYQPPWKLLNGQLLVAFDANLMTSFLLEDYSAGLEYTFGNIISLRAGKIFGRQSKSNEDYTLGMGVRLKNIIFDFSFLSNELGGTSRGTVSYKLGGDYYTPETYRSR